MLNQSVDCRNSEQQFRPAVFSDRFIAGSSDSFNVTASRLMLADSCPKFAKCRAAYCPAIGGTHLKGEPICHYLLESVKRGGAARLRGCVPSELAEVVINEGVLLIASAGPIGKALRRAAVSSSRIESIRRVSATRKVKA